MKKLVKIIGLLLCVYIFIVRKEIFKKQGQSENTIL